MKENEKGQPVGRRCRGGDPEKGNSTRNKDDRLIEAETKELPIGSPDQSGNGQIRRRRVFSLVARYQ